MATIADTLETIARDRKRDPLAPVTVIAPSHIAALQLRRRLAELGAFAGVRFETLPRIAELLAGGDLAHRGLAPLARPIGDYVAGEVALQSEGAVAPAKELAGYAHVLRQTFRRLRRGGFRAAADVPVHLGSGHLAEVVRLYGLFREQTAAFYDEEDLLEVAAAVLDAGSSGFASEMGAVFFLPPAPMSAGVDRLARTLRRRARSFVEVQETGPVATSRFVLAPDPASEAREVVREVLDALEQGCGLHEIAVFHGADRAYPGLLAPAFEAASVPAVLMPGRPLIETPAGRGVLALAELPAADYARAATMDFLNVAPLRPETQADGARIATLPAAWQRMAREAGITHGRERWQSGLYSLVRDRETALESSEELSEARRQLYEADLQRAGGLRSFISTLIARLEPLRQPQAAAPFVTSLKAVVGDYLRADAAGLPEVEAEIDQLGTIDAVGGRFSLDSFAEALRANLTAASIRERSLGEGVLVADYRSAAALRFKRSILCGAYEGVFPAPPATESLLSDEVWSRLREKNPFVEDAQLRSQRGQEAAYRAIGAASEITTWSAPVRDGGGTRELYPAALMTEAARVLDPALDTASALRRAPQREGLRRPASPLAARLSRRVLDTAELKLRQTVDARQKAIPLSPGHPLHEPLRLLTARRGRRFSEFDGNLAALEGLADFVRRQSFSPTALEVYGTCGFRYFLGHVLRLRPVDEPEERDTIDPAERGSLIHAALQAFFEEQQQRGRPGVGEGWNQADVEELLRLADERLEETRQRGRAGLDVYAGFDRQTMRADLAAFLEEDTAFRLETGATPVAFELQIPAAQAGGVALTGFVDRIDRTPDGREAWIIDYKTGSAGPFEKGDATQDPFSGGTRLQLPVYVYAAADAEKVTALYWFITRRGEFKRIEYASTPENFARFEATLAALMRGLNAGAFPAVAGDEDEFFGGFTNCRYCDFDRLCSRRRTYELAEKLDDPDMAQWTRIAEVSRGEGT